MEYVMVSTTPASVKSGTARGPRAGATSGLRCSRVGGIERAGVTSTGRGGATCLVGIGLGTGSGRGRAWVGRAWVGRACVPPCVDRAGVVARDRETALEWACLVATVETFLRFGRLAV